MLVNNVAENDEKLKQLSKPLRSCTAAHEKARLHASLLEFDIKDATSTCARRLPHASNRVRY